MVRALTPEQGARLLKDLIFVNMILGLYWVFRFIGIPASGDGKPFGCLPLPGRFPEYVLGSVETAGILFAGYINRVIERGLPETENSLDAMRRCKGISRTAKLVSVGGVILLEGLHRVICLFG